MTGLRSELELKQCKRGNVDENEGEGKGIIGPPR